MATFEAQVEGLTSLSIDGSSAPTQTELTQFLTDGAKEIINVLPENLLNLCTSSVSFTSGSASTLNTGKISNVLRSDGDITQPCRDVPALYKGRYSDPDDMNYATVTDPIYYIENNSLDVLPAGGSVTYSEVQYPAVAYGDSAIAVFPDEAEYLVPLYASVKALQNALGAKSAYYTAMTDAVNAINTQADNAVSNVSDARTALGNANTRIATAKGEIDLAKIEAAEIASQTDNSGEIETALDAIKTELDKVDEVILLAHEEFDEVAAEVSSTATSPITAARSAVPSALSINDLTVSVSAPSAPSLATISYSDASNADASASSVGSVTVGSVNKADISGHAPAYNKPSLTSRVAFKAFYADTSNANPFGDNDPGDFSLSTPPALSSASFTTPGIGTITVASFGTAPAYSKPTITTQVAFQDYWTLSDFGDSDPGSFGIVASPPAAPSAPSFSTPAVSDISVASLPTAPTYTAPAVASDGTIELTTIVALDSENTIDDFDGNAIEVDQWWTTLAHLIEDEEDTELAGAQIQKINSYINAYSQAMQNQLNVFNDANVEYQAGVQRNLENARISAQDAQQTANLVLQEENQEYAATLQKYQADLSKYQSEVNKEVQEYTQKLSRYQLELNTVYTAWAKTESDNLQKFNSDIQNELNEFNKEMGIYQGVIQEKIKNSELAYQESQQEAQLLLQKEYQEYQSKISEYQAEVNTDVQVYSQKLSKYTMEVDKVYTSWAKTESDTFQQYQLDITNELNEYNANNDIYQANIQAELAKHNSDLQKALTQSQLDATDAQREAVLTTDVDKFNKAQDQALALANASKQMEDAIADNNSKIQKYSAELQSYQTQVTKEVQEYSQNLEGDLNVWQAERQTDLQKYASDIQNELNEFNKEQAVYQNELQEKVQEANNQQTKDSSEYGSKLQKYANEIQSYQADVNKEIQDFVNTLQKEMQEYQSKLALYSADLQKYQSEIGEKTQKVTSATQNAA